MINSDRPVRSWCFYPVTIDSNSPPFSVAEDTDGIEGLGFVFVRDDMIAGVDLDKCRNPETDEIEEWATEIVERLDSYTTISTSGTGLHVYLFGIVPDGGNRKGDVEMYDKDRFFAFTGDHLDGTPKTIETRPEQLKEIHRKYIQDDDKTDQNGAAIESEPLDLSDEELIEKAKNAKNGDFFTDLWEGRWEKHKGRWVKKKGQDASQSEADLALCSLLAFWTRCDHTWIDRLFRKSGLYRKKWDRSDYRNNTIKKAISGVSDVYEPGERSETDESVDWGDSEPPASWAEVRSLFNSDAKGTTTKGYHKAADLLDYNYTIKTIRDSEAIYFYDPGVGYYHRKGETYIKELLQRKLEDTANNQRKHEIIANWRDRNYVNTKEFKPKEGKLNLTKGVLDLETREIEEHSPDYNFTTVLNVDRPATDEELNGNQWDEQVRRALDPKNVK